MMRRTGNEAGFTMVELLIAMAVFSFMMLIVTAGFVQVVRIHQSGVASRATQQNARLVLDTITKDVRQSGKAYVSGTGALKRLCVVRNGQMLEYAVDANGDLYEGALSGTGDSCPDPVFTGWKKINDSNVIVTQFDASTTQAVDPGLGTVMVTLTMASRNNLDALEQPARTRCVPGTGSQFCAVTTLSTTASLRGGVGE